MVDFRKTDNPTIVAKAFAEKQKVKDYNFDFSLRSLEIDLPHFLNDNHNRSLKEREILNGELTAYLGETICRVYNAKWSGHYYGPSNSNGINYYTCKISVFQSDFYVSHYFDRFFSDKGIGDNGTFIEYLHGRAPHPEPNIIYYEGLITLINKVISNNL